MLTINEYCIFQFTGVFAKNISELRMTWEAKALPSSSNTATGAGGAASRPVVAHTWSSCTAAPIGSLEASYW